MQQDQNPIFIQLTDLLNKHSKLFHIRTKDKPKQEFHLWVEKDIELFGKSRKELYFAGIIMQKNYVGFYYMPIYAQPERVKNFFSKDLLKLLKGKSCFHIKQLNSELLTQIDHAIQKGIAEYQQNGWL